MGLHSRGTRGFTLSRNARVSRGTPGYAQSWNALIYTISERVDLDIRGTRGFTV